MERPGLVGWQAETPHRRSLSSKNSVRSRVPAGFLTDGSLRGRFIPSAFAPPAPSRITVRWLVAGGASQSQWRVHGRFSRPSLFLTSTDVSTRAHMWIIIYNLGAPGSSSASLGRWRSAWIADAGRSRARKISERRELVRSSFAGPDPGAHSRDDPQRLLF